MAFTPFKKVKTKSNEQLIQDIDERLKVNKGGFSAEGFNADSSFTPSRVSDKAVANPYDSYNAFQRVSQPQLQTPDFEYSLPQVPQDQFELGTEGSLALEFVNAFNSSVSPSQNSTEEQKFDTFQQTGLPYAIKQMEDGGVLFADSVIRYADGTVRDFYGSKSTPLQYSNPDGTQPYSDGTVRRLGTEQDFVVQENISYMDGGFEGLVSGLFGSNATITQGYNNYNPKLGYKGGKHKGTDIVSHSGSLKLPVGAQVVEVKKDDGTQWGDKTGHRGYGNSVLLKLSNGQMLRFSHLKNPVSFQPGDVIPAMTVFGDIGNTGNSTGQHLDLEVLDASGNPIDPMQFAGFGADNPFRQEAIEGYKTLYTNMQNPQVSQPEEQPKQQGQVMGAQTEQPQVSSIIPPQMQNTRIEENKSFPAQVRGAGKVLGSAIEQQNPTGTVDFGVSETLSGDTQKGREALSGTFERATEGLPTRGRFDLGISELMRGDVEGARQVQQATTENITDKIKQGAGNAITFVNDFLSNIKAPELPKPGEFLNKPAYASELKSPQFSQMNKEYGMQIGDSPTSSMVSQPSMRMGETYQSRQAESSSDIRDPFFKPGGASQQYSQYLKPNADQVAGGALDTSVFGNDFFERRTAQPDIQSVFGGTHLAGQANQKFEGYRTAENDKAINQIKSMYGGGEWDQADVSRIIAEIRQGKGFIDPSQVRQPSKAYKPTIEDYLRQGKTIAQYYAETGQQGVLDKFGSPEAAMKAYNEGNAAAQRGSQPGQNVDISNIKLSPQQYQQSYQQVTQGSKPSDPNALYRADQQYEQSTQNFGNVYNGMKINLGESASPFDLFKKKSIPNVSGYLKL